MGKDTTFAWEYSGQLLFAQYWYRLTPKKFCGFEQWLRIWWDLRKIFDSNVRPIDEWFRMGQIGWPTNCFKWIWKEKFCYFLLQQVVEGAMFECGCSAVAHETNEILFVNRLNFRDSSESAQRLRQLKIDLVSLYFHDGSVHTILFSSRHPISAVCWPIALLQLISLHFGHSHCHWRYPNARVFIDSRF